MLFTLVIIFVQKKNVFLLLTAGAVSSVSSGPCFSQHVLGRALGLVLVRHAWNTFME